MPPPMSPDIANCPLEGRTALGREPLRQVDQELPASSKLSWDAENFLFGDVKDLCCLVEIQRSNLSTARTGCIICKAEGKMKICALHPNFQKLKTVT